MLKRFFIRTILLVFGCVDEGGVAGTPKQGPRHSVIARLFLLREQRRGRCGHEADGEWVLSSFRDKSA
jgi:hypothetical protein